MSQSKLCTLLNFLLFSGSALLLHSLNRASRGQPLVIESYRNFTINTRGDDGLVENHLFIGHDRFEAAAHLFKVSDSHGRSLFSVDRDAVSIGAQSLKVEGDGGVIFKDSIQTPLIRSEAGKDLR